MSAFERTPGPNDSFYPPSALSADVVPPADFRPCTIPDHLGENFTNHIDFTRLGNKRYWVLFWPKTAAGMYSLKTDVVAAAQEAGAAAARRGVLESYTGWGQVWAAWAQHCWVRHTRCSTHNNACCDGQCPEHPHPTNPEAITVATHRSIKQEAGGHGVPPKRIKTEAPSSSAGKRGARRRRTAALSDDEDNTPKAPLYDPDTPPERNRRRRGEADEVTAALPSPTAVRGTGPAAGAGVRRIEDIRAAYIPPQGSSSVSAVPSSSASAVPSSATPSSVSSLSASTAAPSTMGGSAAVAGLDSAQDASSMDGVDGGALRVALRTDTFYVGAQGKICHSREEALDVVSNGPVQVVIGWDAATALAVELVRERAARKGKGKETEERMDVDCS
ncbi:hypothetical protein C8F04DRAFT_1271519 [Mycena alexandri]|uniref:Uncharacterized protein n=1 Tax=Mycena alexandri TaxID=1745969 RepID=A0AAD6WTU9_9AGAR|nr:hypothetical protein C8F04DRAFT_1271519 [Mycena alexandri]